MKTQSESDFPGFQYPQQNWFKLPNEWTDITAGITSLAELKIVQYILRHTWGYHEYGQVKCITLDEFEHGRKKKDGTRMDRGIGMGRQAIIDGIRRAVDHGFLLVEIDDSDKGRVKKSYGLRMQAGVRNSYARGMTIIPQGSENHTPYRERHLGKTLSGGRVTSPTTKKGFTLGEFHTKGAACLKEVLVTHNSDLVQSPRRLRIDTLAKSLFRLETERGIPRKQIKEIVLWLKDHYGDDFTPKMRKADDLFTKWGQFCEAKQRSENNQQRDTHPRGGPPELTQDRIETIGEIQNRLEEKFGWEGMDYGNPAIKEELEEVLKDMGLEPGAFKTIDI